MRRAYPIHIPPRLTLTLTLSIDPPAESAPRRTIDSSVMSSAARSTAAGRIAAPSARMAAGGDKHRHTWNRLDALGIGDLAQRPSSEWAVEPSAAELRLAQSLEEAVETRVRGAVDPGKLATAETYLERFSLAMPSRLLFRKRGGNDDAEARAHNNQTFELLREFIRQHGSIRPGQLGTTLSADTISDYVGALSEALSITLRGDLAGDEAAKRKRRQQKSWLLEDGPKGADRTKLRLAFRGQHFKLVSQSAFDHISPQGQYRWTVGLVSWQCLMRPGEPGQGGGHKPWNPQRGLKLSDVVWWSSDVTQDGRPAVVLNVLPIKDKDGRSRRQPCPISAQTSGAPSSPASAPCCTYTQFAHFWRTRAAAVCIQRPPCMAPRFCHRCLHEPLFASPVTGATWRTPDGTTLVRDMCVAIGEDPSSYEGYCLRIGGATDLAEAVGPERAAAVTEERGRWRSDIAYIYRRRTTSTQLEASALMLDAGGHTIESVMPGWVQPARGRRHR